MSLHAGIDIGGTKIEAGLFDDDWKLVEIKRQVTNVDSYEALIAQIVDLANSLIDTPEQGKVSLGIGIPGLIDQSSEIAITSNLPCSGKPLKSDITKRIKQPLVILNDCDAFTLSEAVLGAGRDTCSVIGLIMGTGLAGGYALDGKLVHSHNGTPGEFGHIPISGKLTRSYNLPIVKCGCGMTGCYETLASGPGLVKLAQHFTGEILQPADIIASASKLGSQHEKTIDVWSDLIAEMLGSVIRVVDPEKIVLGGGLSKIPQVENMIIERLADQLYLTMKSPKVCLAEGGDSSGTRGAALAAVKEL